VGRLPGVRARLVLRASSIGVIAACGCASSTDRFERPEPRKTEPPAAVSCAPAALFNLTGKRAPPLGDAAKSASVQLFTGQPGALREVRDLLDAAVPVDPCDPSITPYQYSLRFQGTFDTDEGRFVIRSFLGARVVIEWPDGARTMFDSHVPRWASSRVAPWLRRKRGADAECADSPNRGRNYRFEPTEPATEEQQTELRKHCDPLGPPPSSRITRWCCEG